MDKPAYKTDAFRMMVMKVAPCSKKFCHDWVRAAQLLPACCSPGWLTHLSVLQTVCPFAHPGEKARRRNPRTHDYTGVACPDMKKVRACCHLSPADVCCELTLAVKRRLRRLCRAGQPVSPRRPVPVRAQRV